MALQSFRIPSDAFVSGSLTASAGLIYNDLTVSGNLNVVGVVTGSFTRINSTDLYITDKVITIGSSSTAVQADLGGAGIEFGNSGLGLSLKYYKMGPQLNGQLSASTGFVAAGDITSSANISASAFYGNGAGLTNLNVNSLDLSGYAEKQAANTFTWAQTVPDLILSSSGNHQQIITDRSKATLNSATLTLPTSSYIGADFYVTAENKTSGDRYHIKGIALAKSNYSSVTHTLYGEISTGTSFPMVDITCAVVSTNLVITATKVSSLAGATVVVNVGGIGLDNTTL